MIAGHKTGRSIAPESPYVIHSGAWVMAIRLAVLGNVCPRGTWLATAAWSNIAAGRELHFEEPGA